MPAGVVVLGQVAARLPVLEVAYNRCDRRGRLRVDRLLAEHGPALPMSELRRIIAADCPRMIAGHTHDVCGGALSGAAAASHISSPYAAPAFMTDARPQVSVISIR